MKYFFTVLLCIVVSFSAYANRNESSAVTKSLILEDASFSDYPLIQELIQIEMYQMDSAETLKESNLGILSPESYCTASVKSKHRTKNGEEVEFTVHISAPCDNLTEAVVKFIQNVDKIIDVVYS